MLFTYSKFNGPVYFYRTLFQSDVFLDECIFEDKVLFVGQQDQVHFRCDMLNPDTIRLLSSQGIFLPEEEDPQSFVLFNSFSSAEHLASKLDTLNQGNLSPREKSLIISIWQEGTRKMFSQDGISTFRATNFRKKDEASFVSVNMNNVFLQGSNIGSVKFLNIQWYRLKFNDWFPGYRRAIRDEGVARNTTQFEQAATIYSDLKKNYSNNGNHLEAIDFHYGQMEMKRKQGKTWQQYFSFLALYKYLSGYGVRYQVALFWLVFLVCFVFPTIYLMINYTSRQTIINQMQISLLHSLEAITFKSEAQALSYAIRYVEQWERILVGGMVFLTLDAVRYRIWGIR